MHNAKNFTYNGEHERDTMLGVLGGTDRVSVATALLTPKMKRLPGAQ